MRSFFCNRQTQSNLVILTISKYFIIKNLKCVACLCTESNNQRSRLAVLIAEKQRYRKTVYPVSSVAMVTGLCIHNRLYLESNMYKSVIDIAKTFHLFLVVSDWERCITADGSRNTERWQRREIFFSNIINLTFYCQDIVTVLSNM